VIPLAVQAWQVVCGEVSPDTVLDIREPEAFSRAHIPGALDPARTVLVVDPGGARAAEMAVWLRGAGFEAGFLEGGMAGWTGDLETPRRRRR
jgi:rhodanese-related sulfurtransferase